MTIDLHNPSDEMIEAVAKVVRAEVVASQRPDASLGTRGFEERVAGAAIAALAGMTPPVAEVDTDDIDKALLALTGDQGSGCVLEINVHPFENPPQFEVDIHLDGVRIASCAGRPHLRDAIENVIAAASQDGGA